MYIIVLYITIYPPDENLPVDASQSHLGRFWQGTWLPLAPGPVSRSAAVASRLLLGRPRNGHRHRHMRLPSRPRRSI